MTSCDHNCLECIVKDNCINRHPLIKECYDVMQAIEECGVSEKLTGAVVKAGELLDNIRIFIDTKEKK